MESNRDKKKTGNSVLRHYAIVMAFAVVCVSVPFFLFQFVIHESYDADTIKTAPIDTATTTQTGMTRSLPVRLRIPTLKIDVPFEEPPLGLNADKTVEAPRAFTDVGWYKYGATPGEIGPSVVLGHVDTYKGPAVFFYLGQLKPGDEVFVDRADGSTADFEVQELHRYSQDDFPSALVYGPINYPGLRLITCTGVYDHGVQRYDHNLVVYARLKETASSTVVKGIQ